jgi:hypothetical protein
MQPCWRLSRRSTHCKALKRLNSAELAELAGAIPAHFRAGAHDRGRPPARKQLPHQLSGGMDSVSRARRDDIHRFAMIAYPNTTIFLYAATITPRFVPVYQLVLQTFMYHKVNDSDFLS